MSPASPAGIDVALAQGAGFVIGRFTLETHRAGLINELRRIDNGTVGVGFKAAAGAYEVVLVDGASKMQTIAVGGPIGGPTAVGENLVSFATGYSYDAAALLQAILDADDKRDTVTLTRVHDGTLRINCSDAAPTGMSGDLAPTFVGYPTDDAFVGQDGMET